MYLEFLMPTSSLQDPLEISQSTMHFYKLKNKSLLQPLIYP